jgi:hypothetical protein
MGTSSIAIAIVIVGQQSYTMRHPSLVKRLSISCKFEQYQITTEKGVCCNFLLVLIFIFFWHSFSPSHQHSFLGCSSHSQCWPRIPLQIPTGCSSRAPSTTTAVTGCSVLVMAPLLPCRSLGLPQEGYQTQTGTPALGTSFPQDLWNTGHPLQSVLLFP